MMDFPGPLRLSHVLIAGKKGGLLDALGSSLFLRQLELI
jgi:hypothetical protein